MRRFVLAVALLVLLMLAGIGGKVGGADTAAAAADPQSNCAAVLTSFFGPEGAVDNAVHILQQAAREQGIPFGELARMVAQSQGTLNQCLALVGQPPVAGG